MGTAAILMAVTAEGEVKDWTALGGELTTPFETWSHHFLAYRSCL